MKTVHQLSWLAGGILGFSLLNGCGAVDQPAVESTGGGPEAVATDIVVKLTAANPRLAARDDVQVLVTLTNVSEHAVSLLRYNTVVDGIQGNLFNVTRDGAPVQYVGRVYKRVAPQASDYITLNAGESIARTVSLSGAYDFSATGRYSVSHAGAAKSAVALNSNSVDLFVEGRPNVLPEQGGEAVQAIAKGDPSALSTTNCTASRTTSISTALSSATTYAVNATNYLTNTTPGNTARYKTWFGNYTSSNWSTVRTHYTNIRNAFQNQNVVVDCSCTDTGTYAYVYPTQPYKIYVCGAFWSAPNTGTDSRAGTLVHEMSHFNVVAGTDDWAYGQSAAKSLAISNPTRAVDNADSHEYFAENTPAQN